MIRDLCPNAAIIMGGPHATTMWNHAFEQSPVDAIIMGEGELTLAKLLNEIDYPKEELPFVDVSSYPGLITRDR